VTALERLIAEGYLIPRRSSGIYVAATLPDVRMRPGPAKKRAPAAVASHAARLSRRGAALAAVVITGPRREDGPLPFHPRRPALDLFPARVWARLVAGR